MSSEEASERLIQSSLFDFVTRHIPRADLSVVDEIVLSYLTAILEEVSQDPVFDVDGFSEMMSAYFPNFNDIEPNKICCWIIELASQLERCTNHEDLKTSNLSLSNLSLNDILPQNQRCKQRRVARESLSEQSDAGSHSDADSSGGIDAVVLYSEECETLQEMFPDTCVNEVRHCITVACGDLDRATQILLHRQETGQSLRSVPIALTTNRHCHASIDDSELKNRIIERYSYVDKCSDLREHHPVAPKYEPKKLVRYRDNKIVSLKGERYTEVSHVVGDEPKKSRRPHCP